MNFTSFGRELTYRPVHELLPVLTQHMPREAALQLLETPQPVASRKRPKTTITGEQLHDAIATSIGTSGPTDKRVVPVLTVISSRQLTDLETEETRVEPRTKIRVRPDLTAVIQNQRIAIDYKLAWEAPSSAPFRAALQVAVGWAARWLFEHDADEARGEIWYVHPETGEVTIVVVPELNRLIRTIPSLHNLVNPFPDGRPRYLN